MAQSYSRFDPAEYLDTEEGIEEFMLAAWETGDPAFIAKSLGVVAKARNMTQLAAQVGMSRSALYRALSGEGNPEFTTIMRVMSALGLHVGSIKQDQAAASRAPAEPSPESLKVTGA